MVFGPIHRITGETRRGYDAARNTESIESAFLEVGSDEFSISTRKTASHKDVYLTEVRYASRESSTCRINYDDVSG